MPDDRNACYFELEDVGGSTYGGPAGWGRPCRWKLIGPNGVVATSERYPNRDSAMRAIDWTKHYAGVCDVRDRPRAAS